MFSCPKFKIKLYSLSIISLRRFLRELGNPLSKAVPGTFHASGGHTKHNCLQDQANFHRSRNMVNFNSLSRMTHICVSKLTIIGSDNGLSPGRRQAIIWTNAGILLIRTLRTNFSDILSEIHGFSFTKMHLKCRLRIGVHFVSASMC